MDDLNRPATRGDIEELRNSTKGDIEELRNSTKSDIEELRNSTKGDIGRLAERLELLRSETNHQYNDVVERIADSQTELLKAFYSYAQGNNKRVAEVEGNEGAFRSRLATIEDRILEVERRLNIPPAAA